VTALEALQPQGQQVAVSPHRLLRRKTTTKIERSLTAAVIAAILLLGATTSQAAKDSATVVTEGDVATAIRGLQIGGLTYDATFPVTSSSAIYGTPPRNSISTPLSRRETPRGPRSRHWPAAESGDRLVGAYWM